MRVLWRVATLALALLAATVSGEHSAASVDTVILHVAADSTVNQTIVDQVIRWFWGYCSERWPTAKSTWRIVVCRIPY